MYPLIVRFTQLVWFIALFLLVLVATYMAAGRQFFPFVTSYKADLELLLTEQLSVPVSIGSIQGSWRWLDPVLVVSDIKLKPPNDLDGGVGYESSVSSPLHINSFYIHLSVIQSLRHGKLQFQSIEASGITLSLHQSSEGEWAVPGLPVSDNRVGDDLKSILSVLEQPSLYISDIQVDLLSSTGSNSAWTIPSAVMTYDGTAFSASGEILDTNSKKPFVRFSAKGAGWVLSSEFTGKLYLDWASGPLINQYLGAYQWQGVHLEKIDASGRLWLDFLEGEVLSLQGEIDAETLQWESEKGLVHPLKNIKADIFWSRLDSSSILSLYDLSMEWRNYRWSPAAYSIYLSDKQISASGQHINLSMLTELLLATNVLPSGGQQELEAYRPSGSLTNFELIVPLELVSESSDEKPAPLFQLEANIEDVSALAVGGAPGATGMTGYLLLDDRQGAVFVDSDDFTLSFPNLFLDGWSFEKSQVIVNWDIADSGDINVSSSGINLFLTEESLVFGEFSLLLSDTEEDILALKVGLNDLDATRTHQLVPYHVVDEGIYNWLKTSIKGGMVKSGLYVGYGSIEDDAPENSFTSSMVFNTSGARLLFDSEWPELEGLNSKIFLQNGYLNIDAPEVSFRGSPLSGTRVELSPNVEKAESWLKVFTQTRPSDSDLRYWLNDSPVKEYTRKVSEQLMLHGEFDVDVELSVPLHDMGLGVDYDLAIDVKNAEFKHRPTDLVFEHVYGLATLSSRSGISAERVKLDILGYPAELNIQSDILPGNMQTNLVLAGDMSISALSDWFSLPQDLPVTGQSAYTAALDISSDSAKAALLTLTSPLSGIGISLPSPFDKKAEVTTPLTIQMEIDDGVVSLDASLGDIANAKALFDNGELRKGGLFIGDGHVDDLADNGINITGVLEQLAVGPWVDYLSSSSGRDSDTDTAIQKVALQVTQLNIYDQLFHSVDIVIQSEADEWSIGLKGDDVEGTVYLPPENHKPNIVIKKVQLASANSGSLGDDLSPFDVPEMTLLVDDLIIDGVGYGQWSADLVRKENGVVAKDIKGSLAGANFQGRLSWMKDVYGTSTSILTATIDGGNVAAVSKAVNKPESLTSEHFSSEVSVVWSGAPTEFQLADLSGRIVLMLEDGTLLDTKSATEAFKVFGILNAEAITRRLTLDFSDLYQKGLGYDRIEGVARMDKGTLTLEQPLALQGPSSAYKFTGSANLKDETLDMDMVVVLPLTKNLPLAALFLGAPQIGGAVWVIDKLLGEPLSKLTSATYEMKGSWDDPEIKLKNVFDRTETFNGMTPSQRRREE